MTRPKQVPPEDRLELLIDPLDFLVLGELPEQGTLAFGAYPTGPTVRELSGKIADRIGEAKLPSSVLSSRMRVLGYLGLAVKYTGLGTGSKHVWQRTPDGKQFYDEWRARHGDNS